MSTVPLLWLALIAGQAAWLLDMQVGYPLVHWACGTHQTWALPVATLTAFVLALGSAFVSWRRLPSPRCVGAGTPLAETEWLLAVAGIALSLLSALVILGMAVPRILLDPCA